MIKAFIYDVEKENAEKLHYHNDVLIFKNLP